MERRAYDVAVRDDCKIDDDDGNILQDRKFKRIAMTELFDMISGSETGAIIASALVIPDENN